MIEKIKKHFKKIVIALLGILTLTAAASTILMVPQGGTGTSTLTGVVVGNGTGALTTNTTGALASDLNIDSNTFVISYDDNKVGLGTTTPAYKLDVVGSIQTDTAFYGDYWISATNNSMNIQPTGDTDDFFSFKTPADRPTIKREGGKYIYIESSNVNDVGISFRKDADHSGTVNYYKDTNEFGLTSKDPIVFKACEDYDDYIEICAVADVPEMSTVGAADFKINAGGANNLLLNHSGGYVGIGDATPVALLTVGDGGDFQISSTGVVTFTGTGDIDLPANSVDEADLKSVNAPTDEYVLTYESTTGDFEWQECAGGAGGVGGTYGINIESLTGAITITANTDEIYQYLNPNGAHRAVYIATADAVLGDRFVIRNNGTYTDIYGLYIYQGATEFTVLYAGSYAYYVFDGTNWISNSLGIPDNENKRKNYAVGHDAKGYDSGMAIGESANGYDEGISLGNYSIGYARGVGIGFSALGYTRGVGIGYNADGANYGVSIGYSSDTNLKKYSTAIGYYSKTERTSEFAMNINGSDTDQENNLFTIGLEKQTTDNTPIEMLAGGQSGERITIRASSSMTFTALITARDNVAGHIASYKFEGAIKRDASNNTSLVGTLTKDVIAEEDVSWDASITADDTNEALLITVMGDVTNITQWSARVDGVETHF